MIPAQLKQIIADQQLEHHLPEPYIKRMAEEKLTQLTNNKEIIVLTGVRRCGKSVLLQQVREHSLEKDYYFNFEDDRLIEFTLADFQTLYETFQELFGPQKTFYFDEIQNIPGWERFVRRIYNSGNKIYITGSNATLFSEELGTRLTGRYIAQAIYPLSFYEFVEYQDKTLLNKKSYSTQDIAKQRKLFSNYCVLGGFPEFVHFKQVDYLHSLYESIIYRDIIVRYKLTGEKLIKQLVFYLASNCSKEFTYSSLKKALGFGSATTVSDYCGYLENSFLCFFVNRYSESVKIQIQSPKKVYFVDVMLARTIGFRFSQDKGRVLENLVYLALKKEYEVYYHQEKKECDFIIRKNAQIVGAIQVCQHLNNTDTREREFSGLLEALDRYSLVVGLILTEYEEATEKVSYKEKIYQINILPIWKFLLQKA